MHSLNKEVGKKRKKRQRNLRLLTRQRRFLLTDFISKEEWLRILIRHAGQVKQEALKAWKTSECLNYKPGIVYTPHLLRARIWKPWYSCYLQAANVSVAHAADWSKWNFQSRCHPVESKTPFPFEWRLWLLVRSVAADSCRKLKISFFDAVSGNIRMPPEGSAPV